MKKFIGILIILLSLSFIGILILKVWGIHIVSTEQIVKSTTTLLLLGLLIIVLIIVYGVFLKNNTKSYNNQIGNKAHPKL